MYNLYADDSILVGICPKEINEIFKLMKQEDLGIIEERTLEYFLGLNIDHKVDITTHITQPHLIESILTYLNLLGTGVINKETPASLSIILMRYQESKQFDSCFNYRSVIYNK